MNFRYLWLVPIIMGIAQSGNAEFYKYTNREGVVVFTDDLARIPADQRTDASQYEESPSQDVPDDKNRGDGEDLQDESLTDNSKDSDDQEDAEPEDEKDSADSSNTSNTSKTGLAGNGRTRPDSAALNQEKILLDKEYLSLKAEKELLKESKANLKSREELQDYNEKIVNMNERISAYESRRKAYMDQVGTRNPANSE
jgi:hypothetical protein